MDVKQAISNDINKEGYAFVLYDGDVRNFGSYATGIRPVLQALDTIKTEECRAGDKVVGKAAAVVLCLSKVSFVYAGVLSVPAKQLLESNNIECEYETLVPLVKNREKTGLCPLEQTVLEEENLEQALLKLREKLADMQIKRG